MSNQVSNRNEAIPAAQMQCFSRTEGRAGLMLWVSCNDRKIQGMVLTEAYRSKIGVVTVILFAWRTVTEG